MMISWVRWRFPDARSAVFGSEPGVVGVDKREPGLSIPSEDFLAAIFAFLALLCSSAAISWRARVMMRVVKGPIGLYGGLTSHSFTKSCRTQTRTPVTNNLCFCSKTRRHDCLLGLLWEPYRCCSYETCLFLEAGDALENPFEYGAALQ